jgi:hypothetical protein
VLLAGRLPRVAATQSNLEAAFVQPAGPWVRVSPKSESSESGALAQPQGRILSVPSLPRSLKRDDSDPPQVG